MIKQESVDAVRASKFSKSFVKPLYGSYCFAHIPTLVNDLFGSDSGHPLSRAVLESLPARPRNVVFFLIDAFGWRFYEKHREASPFLRRFDKGGLELMMTSQFPSTTAAHVTTLHTGQPVGESGVHEWFYYEPVVDDVIMPLMFSFGRDRKRRNSLVEAGVTAESILPRGTLYQQLAARGVRSMVFQNREYAESPYSQAVLKGSEIVPVRSFEHAVESVASELTRATTGNNYYFVYADNFDGALHTYGPDSPQANEEINLILDILEKSFLEKLGSLRHETLMLLTADHGQVEIDPGTTFYLDNAFDDFPSYLRTSSKGTPLVPGGSPRDFFLYVRDEKVAEAYDLLSRGLEGRAEVYRVADLVKQGFFGPNPGPRLLERLASLVVLPYAGQSIWWSGGGMYNNLFWGHHGGLTPQEMEIPLIAMQI